MATLPGGGSGASAAITQEVVMAFVNDAPPAAGRIRITQEAVLAFVNDTPLATPPATGVNAGTPIVQPYSVHLDRKVRLAGTYNGGTNKTSWTLPIADSTLTAIVLASTAFGANNGALLAGTYAAGVVSVTGDYHAGPVIIGRPFTMSVELTRPYRRDYPSNTPIISDRLQQSVFYASHQNTGDYTIRASMPTVPARADRTKVFSYPTVGGVEEHGEVRATISGKCEDLRMFIESSLPRPVTITGLRYSVEYAEDQG